MLRSTSLPTLSAILAQMEAPICYYPQESPCIAGSSLDVKLQLIRCYWLFFSRWKTRGLLSVENSFLKTVSPSRGWEAKKKARQRAHTSVPTAPKDRPWFTSKNEIYVISLLL